MARKRKVREEHIQADVPYDMLRRLTPLFTSRKTSHEDAAAFVAAFYVECSIDLSDVVLSVPSSKRIRSGENKLISEKALCDLSQKVAEKDIPLTLHFDTKQLEQRMIVKGAGEEEEESVARQGRGRKGNRRRRRRLGANQGGQGQEEQEGQGQGGPEEQEGQEGQEGHEVHGQRRLVRSTKDRLAVVVTGPELEGEHLLCTPGLEGDTAVEQAEALYAVLVKYNLDPYVASLVFDTTATNTGRHGGSPCTPCASRCSSPSPPPPSRPRVSPPLPPSPPRSLP